jgi:hypothetical protein
MRRRKRRRGDAAGNLKEDDVSDSSWSRTGGAAVRPAPGGAAGGRTPVDEFYVPADVGAMNAALEGLGLDARDVLAVIYLPTNPMIDSEPARFRVIHCAPSAG